MRRRYALAAIVFIILGWNVALVAAPHGHVPRVGAMTYLAGSLICHQQPARSFHSRSAQYPVCARCLGLYVGALAGVLGWVVIAGVSPRPSIRATRLLEGRGARRALIIAGSPTVATVMTASAGIWDPANVMRAALAIPLGAVIAMVIAAVAAGDLR